MSDPLSIGNEMTQFDRKNRAFYDSLTDDEKKKFSPYIMIRRGSLVGGGADLQAYYVMSCNERLNKHFFDINTTQHKKLQWLLATTVSPGMGTHRHQWLALPKKGGSGGNKSVKFLRTLFPAMKDDEIKLLASLNDKDDLKALAQAHGMADKDIKDLL